MVESAPNGDSFILLGDFGAPVGNDSGTWRGVFGRNTLSDLNPSGVLLLDLSQFVHDKHHVRTYEYPQMHVASEHSWPWSMIDLIVVS